MRQKTRRVHGSGPGCAFAKQRLIKVVFHITFASSIALFQFLPLPPSPTLKLTFPGLAVRVQAIPALAQLDLASRTALDNPCDCQIICCEFTASAERNQGSRSSTLTLSCSSDRCVLDFPSEPLTHSHGHITVEYDEPVSVSVYALTRL